MDQRIVIYRLNVAGGGPTKSSSLQTAFNLRKQWAMDEIENLIRESSLLLMSCSSSSSSSAVVWLVRQAATPHYVLWVCELTNRSNNYSRIILCIFLHNPFKIERASDQQRVIPMLTEPSPATNVPPPPPPPLSLLHTRQKIRCSATIQQ